MWYFCEFFFISFNFIHRFRLCQSQSLTLQFKQPSFHPIHFLVSKIIKNAISQLRLWFLLHISIVFVVSNVSHLKPAHCVHKHTRWRSRRSPPSHCNQQRKSLPAVGSNRIYLITTPLISSLRFFLLFIFNEITLHGKSTCLAHFNHNNLLHT